MRLLLIFAVLLLLLPYSNGQYLVSKFAGVGTNITSISPTNFQAGNLPATVTNVLPVPLTQFVGSFTNGVFTNFSLSVQKCHRGSHQLIPSDTFQNVVFDTTEWCDLPGFTNSDTTVFRAPVTGRYRITSEITLEGQSVGSLNVMQSGFGFMGVGDYCRYGSQSVNLTVVSTNASTTTSTIFHLAAGEYVTVAVAHITGANAYIASEGPYTQCRATLELLKQD